MRAPRLASKHLWFSPMRIESIAIIGATDLGCQFAALALRAGCRTILEDVSISVLERAASTLRDLIANSRAAAPSMTAALTLAHSVEDAIRDADLIIEAVADELEMKLELFTIFDRFAKPDAIFASTTASLAVDDLAEMTMCPERCIGMQFVSSEKAEELQLRPGRATSLETLESCREVVRRMGLAVMVGLHGEPSSRSGR